MLPLREQQEIRRFSDNKGNFPFDITITLWFGLVISHPQIKEQLKVSLDPGDNTGDD